MSGTSARDAEPVAIIAGNGRLPLYVAEAAREVGTPTFIVQLRGEGGNDWSDFEHMDADLGGFQPVVAALQKRGIRRVVLSGGVRTRPELKSLRPTARVIWSLPAILKKLRSGGDDKVLRMVIDLFERHGFEIIAAQDIAGDLLATAGTLGAVAPDREDRSDIDAAARAAHVIGSMDIGQGAVSLGGRVVALEGAEGTDQMLERVRTMRAAGRISKKRRGVLVKLCKPQQDLRADLPSIGPETVRAAAAAGLGGIAVEAGRALVLDREAAIAEADRAGLFLLGLEPGQAEKTVT
ncbi:UDP-2,3-diacylglucosamine diphosphatase LpxI [Martelella lutilitoris]|uniref:UDP-2,3-diacylglucosamine diphosphatase LpxI n=1 Tax=Martelella lutilitoris TaxID=2583532 RepID=A0A7T7HGU0_9HYPH|nr:UDP-2,3-diacylglucosamine diphosphatase LpxI [Martelella lutilitoris]QQM28936.1 UDP-2,3-diacylglucosamine diphosphatase LpxI [Martelella lutilitoris]